MDRVDLAALGVHLALISLLAIGGVNSILPDIQRYVVEAHHWLSAKQFADAFALAQAAPGPNVMFLTLIGWQVAGFTGALVATLSSILPPFLLTLGASYFDARNPDAPLGRAIRDGLGPMVIGLTLASGWILARSADQDWRGATLTLLTVALVLRTKLNPIWLIAAGATAGITGIV